MTFAMAMAGWDDRFDALAFLSPEVKGFRRSCWYQKWQFDDKSYV